MILKKILKDLKDAYVYLKPGIKMCDKLIDYIKTLRFESKTPVTAKDDPVAGDDDKKGGPSGTGTGDPGKGDTDPKSNDPDEQKILKLIELL